jgi:AraC-like DNA-binding protein
MRQRRLNSRQGDGAPTGGHATVSSEYLRLVAAGAEARGLDIGPIYVASGIDRAIVGKRGARVSAGAVADAWKRTTRRLGDPLFGLTLAPAIPLGAMSLLDYVAMSSADVGAALAAVARYSPLMSDAEWLGLTVHGNEARFRFHNGADIPYAIEMIVGLFVRRTRELFGPDWAIKRVNFAHLPQGSRATYDRICQVPVQFGAPFTEAVFARELLSKPMPGADQHLNSVLTAEAEAALEALAGPSATPSFITTVVRTLEDGLREQDLTLSRMAEQLGVSVRTLQRRLRAAGISHRGLVRDVREGIAHRSLATHVSQGQIARSLGYSGAGAFQRAFKRWSGMTPGQHRSRSGRSD